MDIREVQAGGAFNTKEERYHFAAEYVEVVRKTWLIDEHFDWDGEFFEYRGAKALRRPAGGALTVYWGGTSDLTRDLCGKVTDVYMLDGETFAGVGEVAGKALAAAKRQRRDVSLIANPVLGLDALTPKR